MSRHAFSNGAIPFLLDLIDRFWEWKMPKKWYAIFAAVGLFLAMFSAWREQYHAAADAGEKLNVLVTPHFDGGIDMVWVFPAGNHKQDTVLVLTAHIRNLGAPSIAEFEKCSVKTASGKESVGKVGPTPFAYALPLESVPKSHLKLVLIREENILTKSTASPIATGGSVSGWLYLVFSDISENEVFQRGTVISLAF